MKTIQQVLIAALTLGFASPAFTQPTSGNTAKGTQSAGQAAGGKSTLRRSSRMEFDGRLVKGERAAGAVYLFQRAPRRLPPLLKLKRDQLDRIVLPVLKRPADPVAPVAEPGAATKTASPIAAPKQSDRRVRSGRKGAKLKKTKKKRRKRGKRKRKGRKKNR